MVEPIDYQVEDSTVEEEVLQPVKKSKTWLFILIAVLLVGVLVAGIVVLAIQGEKTTSTVRDIFIILMAVESMVIGIALIILVVQLASLTNLLQNEIKPILKSTSETMDTLKGTTAFLSDNLATPVIKVNSQLAGVKKLFDLAGLFKK